MERVDDLQINNLKLIQNTDQFCFGIDAVLLANYASRPIRKPPERILDLCTGNGIIPVLLSAKTTAKKIVGVEIQPEAAELAKRNVELNGLAEKLEIIRRDIKDCENLTERGSFDLVTCNPPYKEAGGGLVSESDNLAIARHEIYCTLEDVIRVSSVMLAELGRFCMVHRPDRLVDALTLMRKYRIEPKRLKFVHPSHGKAANLILFEGIKYGRPKLFLDPPEYVYD